jgi:DNA-binding response OmpR family regulator
MLYTGSNTAMPVSPKKILVAEDDAFLSTLLKNRLAREGFDVLTVGHGDEVIPLIKKEKPDLLLLDIILPGKVGYDILEDLSKAGSKLPFMVISNLSQDEDIKRAKSYGALEYFVKAKIGIDDLVSRVKQALGKG